MSKCGPSTASMQRYAEPETVFLPHRDPQEASPLHCLPPEVLAVILSYVDGFSIIRLSRTCALFFNLVNNRGAWEKYVLLGDNEFYHFADLGINFGIPLWRVAPHQAQRPLRALGYPWKQMFYSTQMWKSPRTWDFQLFSIGHVSLDEITAFNIAGQDVVFGTVKGELGLWNPDKFGSCLKNILHAGAEVDQILVQVTSDLNYRIITHCIDTSVVIYDMRGYAISKGTYKRRNLRKISGCRDSLYEWDPETGSSANAVVKMNAIETGSSYSDRKLQGGPFVAADIFEQLFISQKQGPLLIEYDPKRLQNSGKFLLDSVHSLCISRAYIWPQHITFSISAGGITIVSVGRKCKLIRWPPGFKCVSAFLFAHVLMVGTNIGQVLFYPFEDPDDLLEIEPQNYQQAIDTGTSEAIMYVGVRVQNSIHHLPDVIAATNSKLFCFRADGFL